MACTVYMVSPTSEGWVVHHNDKASTPYETVEAAFEAACDELSLKLEQGLQATVTISQACLAGSALGRDRKSVV